MPAARKSAAQVYVATQSFSCELDGESIFVNKDDRVRAGHPLLRAQPGFFAPADEDVRYDVEQATAAPGEKRER